MAVRLVFTKAHDTLMDVDDLATLFFMRGVCGLLRTLGDKHLRDVFFRVCLIDDLQEDRPSYLLARRQQRVMPFLHSF